MARIRVKLHGLPCFRGSDAESLVRRAARAAASHCGLSFDTRIDITLTNDAGIHKINLEHRNVDNPTDVLSFPMQTFEHGVPRFDPAFEADADRGLVMLGDIMLSLERARAQSEEYGHSFARECAYLTVHSALHLLGFDHETEPEKALMRLEEERILSRMGLEKEQFES